jgi:hypothetical protein
LYFEEEQEEDDVGSCAKRRFCIAPSYSALGELRAEHSGYASTKASKTGIRNEVNLTRYHRGVHGFSGDCGR